MKIQIKAVGMDLSDSTKVYVEEKVGKLDKLLANGADAAMADVHLIYAAHDTKATKDKCHITISGLGQGRTAHAETEEPEMHVAIDRAVNKLAEQLRRLKDKLTDHLRRDATEAKHQPAETFMETDTGPFEAGEDGAT